MANGIDIDVGDSLLVGPRGPQGEIGPRGYGIKGIDKTGSNKLVDTYTVTFDDNRTATFEVTNGKGIASIDLTSTVENVDTYTITYNDETTSTFTVTNSNVSREEFEEAVEVINSEMNTKEAEGEKVKLTGVATTNLDITVQGNTYQETTTGKNVFNYTRTTKTVTTNGVTSIINEDGSITLDGTATALIWFPLNSNFDFEVGDYTMYISDEPKSGLILYSDVGNAETIRNFSISEAITKNIALRIISGTSFENFTIYPMILKGTYTLDTIGEYEPFTNGPSPNPDYPQEIQVVTGDNEVQIQGKNLANLSIIGKVPGVDDGELIDVPNGATTDFIEVDSTKEYIFSCKLLNETNVYIFYYDENKSFLYYRANVANGYKPNSENYFSQAKYIRIRVDIRTRVNYIQFEQNSSITSYEPYYKTNYSLSLGTLELAGIGDYQDYLYKNNGKWYVHKGIGKKILNGSENWNTNRENDNYMRFHARALFNVKVQNTGYSNLFIVQNEGGSKNTLSIYTGNDFNVYIWLSKSIADSVADFKTWLSTHNTIVYYVLATPTEEQITDTTLIQQLEALNQATAKGNNFIVTTETENLKPILKVQYKESTRAKANDLEERVEKLEEQIKHAGHVYGVRRKRENNSSSKWERTDDSIGLVANATHDGTEVQNDFDNLSPWKDIISFNLDLETGHKKAYYGDPDFAFDGSNGDVYTHIPDIYYRVWHDEEYDYVQIADFAETEFEKCDKFDIQRYKTGIVNNQLHSYSNIPAAGYRNIASYRDLAQDIGEDYCLLDWRYFVIQLLYLIEYADYNSQLKLGNGFTAMRHNAADVSLLAETNTHRFVVNTNAGNTFVVGQTVSVGTGHQKYDIAESRKITAITDYDSGGITGKSVTLDGAAFTTTITSVIWSSQQHSGQCDSLGMKSGCLANDGKHEVIYRGIEGIFGNVTQWLDGINILDHRAYVCYNPTEYVSDKFEEPYQAIGYLNGATNGYEKELGFDINNPLIRLPISIGGGSSTYITDYYDQASGSRAARVGGSITNGPYNGIWTISLSNYPSIAYWACGARVIKYK